MSNTVMIILKVLHVVGGVFWAGSLVFIARFLMPTLRALGPQGAPVMDQLVRVRRMPLALMAAGILTILSGLTLLPAWKGTGPGKFFGMGGGLAILAAILGMAINTPAARRLGAISAVVKERGGVPTGDESAQLQKLQARIAITSIVMAVLVVLATALMASARYLS